MGDKVANEAKKIVLTLSWKTACFVLIIALIALSIYTKPWEGRGSKDTRKLTINGEALIKRAPDAFQFSPYYEAKSQEEINNKTKEIVAKVKELGLGDAGITTNIMNNPKYDFSGQVTGETVYSLYLTLTADNKELAQKLQDYLVTTKASGPISPNATFSKALQKQLRLEATTKAVEDAKTQADKTAQNLGVKVVRVIEVKETQGQDEIYPMYSSYDSKSLEVSSGSLPINTGESEFTYKVEVIYEIK